MAFIMDMHISDFVKLIIKCYEERERGKAWDMWLTKYPYMSSKNFIPFSEFFKLQTKRPQISKRPAAQILADARKIREKLKKIA